MTEQEIQKRLKELPQEIETINKELETFNETLEKLEEVTKRHTEKHEEWAYLRLLAIKKGHAEWVKISD